MTVVWIIYLLCVIGAALTLPSYGALLYGFLSWLGGAMFTLIWQRYRA